MSLLQLVLKIYNFLIWFFLTQLQLVFQSSHKIINVTTPKLKKKNRKKTNLIDSEKIIIKREFTFDKRSACSRLRSRMWLRAQRIPSVTNWASAVHWWRVYKWMTSNCWDIKNTHNFRTCNPSCWTGIRIGSNHEIGSRLEITK